MKNIELLRNRKCILYARVSSLAQARDGYGLHRQFEDGLKFVREAHLNIVGIFCDVCSGIQLLRPGLTGALKAAQGEYLFLVEDSSRLARSLEVYAQVEQYLDAKGVELYYFSNLQDDLESHLNLLMPSKPLAKLIGE